MPPTGNPGYGALDPLPSLSMSNDAPKEAQMQFLMDLNRGYYDWDLTRRLEDVNIRHKVWATNDLLLARGVLCGCSVSRDTNRHNEDVLCIEAVLGGSARFHPGSLHTKDQITVFSLKNVTGATLENADVATLYIPFEQIGYDPCKHKEEYNLALQGSIGKVVGAALTDVTTRMPYTPSREVPAMIDQVTDLVRDLVLGNRDHINRANLNRARRLAMDAFIEDNLNDPMLQATKHLQQEFNVSRATLYRMFDADGGVEAYVTRRRLHRTMIALKNTVPKRGVIRNVSEGYGFFDAANFNRAFKSEFGFKPSEIVGQRGVVIGV